jgi:hypothetical protein
MKGEAKGEAKYEAKDQAKWAKIHARCTNPVIERELRA